MEPERLSMVVVLLQTAVVQGAGAWSWCVVHGDGTAANSMAHPDKASTSWVVGSPLMRDAAGGARCCCMERVPAVWSSMERVASQVADSSGATRERSSKVNFEEKRGHISLSLKVRAAQCIIMHGMLRVVAACCTVHAVCCV